MAKHRRSAKYECMLLYVDEPQLISLVANKARFVALAVPPADEQRFVVTTVSKRDWASYLRGSIDLRYLFTVPEMRQTYTFDLSSMKEGKVMMDPRTEPLTEDLLPSPRFFAENHTEKFVEEDLPEDVERLIIDGEWELQEFGQFQQRYADIYAFSSAIRCWSDQDISEDRKKSIAGSFRGRPFQGGFSYVHLFKDLNDNVPYSDRIHLNEIQYASPGFVDILGVDDIFSTVNESIENLLANRRHITKSYKELYSFLSKNKYLNLAGDDYDPNTSADKYIKEGTESFAKLLKLPDLQAVVELSEKNTLVTAKVVLSYYRRLLEATSFFSQGRASFKD